MSELETLRRMLGFAPVSDGSDADIALDEKLIYILESSEARLLTIAGVSTVPAPLKHVVIDVSCARFNRIGDEGMSSHSVKDESMSYSDDDFAPYMREIDAYLSSTSKRGKVRFL